MLANTVDVRWRMVLALIVVLGACASARGPMDVGSRIDFIDEGATLSSPYEGESPKIEIEKRGERWFVTVYQGRQPSSGHAIHVERAIAVGTGLRLRARFTVPARGSTTPAVVTSPAHTISIPFGPDGIDLYDQDDRPRAQWRGPYSSMACPRSWRASTAG